MTSTQQQQIMQCIELTKANGVIHYAKSGVLLFATWMLYFFFVVCTLIACWLPYDPLHVEHLFGNGNSVSGTLHIELLSNVMMFMKLIVFLIGVAFAAMGYILGKIRVKNSIIKTVNELLMKINQNTTQ